MSISPPYIGALQSLPGKTAAEKLKELHGIATIVASDDEEREHLLKDGKSSRVKKSLIPLLKIVVADKVKSRECVVEALKSDDVAVAKHALKAKWFFDSSDSTYCNADFYKNQVVPYVSLRTRLDIVKALARGLNDAKKADEFFTYFADSFGVDQSLPLITACSEAFAFEQIVKRRILLPIRLLTILYRKHPDLAIRYLRLAREKKSDREDISAEAFNVDIRGYAEFLPLLVKRHSQIFVELIDLLPAKFFGSKLKLASKRGDFFLKNSAQRLIDNPTLHLKSLGKWKRVYYKLDERQIEIMFRNSFPKDKDQFDVRYAIKLLDGFYKVTGDKLIFLKETYESVYGVEMDVYDRVSREVDCDGHRRRHSIYKLLSKEERKEFAREKLESLKGKKVRAYEDNLRLLPPSESIELLKERINRSSQLPRSHWIEQMIESCRNYDDADKLLEVLKYYNARHKNEQSSILEDVISGLTRDAADQQLNGDHWREVATMVYDAYVADKLFAKVPQNQAPFCQALFDMAFRFYLKGDDEDGTELTGVDSSFDKLVLIFLEGYVEHDWKVPISIGDEPTVYRRLLDKLLSLIPERYDHSHKVWKNPVSRFKIVSKFIGDIRKSNASASRLIGAEKKPFVVGDYPWLTDHLAEIFSEKKFGMPVDSAAVSKIKRRKNCWRITDEEINDSSNPPMTMNRLKKCLSELNCQAYYENLIDANPEQIYNIDDNPKRLLKNHRDKILTKWSVYLDECRNSLVKSATASANQAKRFVLLTKWHQDLPCNFIKKSLLEIEKKGSILVLGLLLDGASFSQIVSDYLPTMMDSCSRGVDASSARKAKEIHALTASLLNSASLANPPVPLDVLSPFCHGDYISIAGQTLACVANKVPKPKVLSFADELLAKPAVSTMKIGIRLKCRVATKQESREFLLRAYKENEHASIRESLAKIILELFVEQPSANTWDLIKICIDGIDPADEAILSTLADVGPINDDFIGVYVGELIKKIESLFSDVDSDGALRKKYIAKVFQKISKNQLNLLDEDFTAAYVEEFIIFPPLQDFIVHKYLDSEGEKFESRIKVLVKGLKAKINVAYKNSSDGDCTKRDVHDFLKKLSSLSMRGNRRMSSRLSDELLTLLTDTIKLWEDPESFMRLRISKSLLEASDLRDFGSRCLDVIEEFVQNLGSEIFLLDFSKMMHEENLSFEFENHNFICGKDEYLIIDGLMSKNERLGSLVGMYILKDCYNYRKSMEDFEAFVERCKKIENPTVKAALNQLLFDKSRSIYFDTSFDTCVDTSGDTTW